MHGVASNERALIDHTVLLAGRVIVQQLPLGNVHPIQLLLLGVPQWALAQFERNIKHCLQRHLSTPFSPVPLVKKHYAFHVVVVSFTNEPAGKQLGKISQPKGVGNQFFDTIMPATNSMRGYLRAMHSTPITSSFI